MPEMDAFIALAQYLKVPTGHRAHEPINDLAW